MEIKNDHTIAEEHAMAVKRSEDMGKNRTGQTGEGGG